MQSLCLRKQCWTFPPSGLSTLVAPSSRNTVLPVRRKNFHAMNTNGTVLSPIRPWKLPQGYCTLEE